MNGFITSQDAAKKWNVTERQVQFLCKSGKIDGAKKLSRIWIIPENAVKPLDHRKKAHKIIEVEK